MLTEQEKRELSHTIKSNEHEIYVLSLEEMEAAVRSSPKGNLPHVQELWQQVRSSAEVGTNFYATGSDSRKLISLIREMGGFTNKAYVRTYGGKSHIIIKGYPGLRKILTGTKYGITNPKVITMGLGKAGAANAVKSGGIVSIVLVTAFRVTDYFLSDDVTLNQLIGSLATDLVKVAVASGVSYIAASALVAAGVTIAVGPIAAVVIVGGLTTIGLTALDERYGITDKLISALDEISARTDHLVDNIKKEASEAASEATQSVIDYIIDSTKRAIIDAASHHLDKLVPRTPRIY